MPITQYLERNAREWPNEVALVALNPTISVPKLTTWKEYDLMEPDKEGPYRKEITWRVFDEKANRVANCLIARGVTKGEKVGILLMN
ncbi:MAG: long-chain fatty acid--CoA ligase, partial [Clostridiales bacterium]|nr:long-chain fatty acid--CoA ligase [Clostridiales bacterium]